MKWQFHLLCKASLRLIGLLSVVIVISCTRSAPRYEPEFLKYYDIASHNPHNPMIDPNGMKTSNGSKPFDLLVRKLSKYYNQEFLKNDLSDLLKDMGCFNLLGQSSYTEELEQELLFLNVVPTSCHSPENYFSLLVEANQRALGLDGKGETRRPIFYKLPNRLCILFDRAREDVLWDERSLANIEALTISSNPLLPNSEKHFFTLMAFIVDKPSRQDGRSQLVICRKLGQKWCYYNNGKKNNLSNEDAIALASKQGTLFFYEKN